MKGKGRRGVSGQKCKAMKLALKPGDKKAILIAAIILLVVGVIMKIVLLYTPLARPISN